MVKQLHTLGDAHDVGLELVAVCRNVQCRHRVIIDLTRLIHAIGEGQPLLPVLRKVHFSEKLRCSACGERGAFLWPQEMKGPEPFFNAQSYHINEWWQGSNLSTVAKVSHVTVAHATFEAALDEYPGKRLTLQQGAYVIRDSRMKVLKGGRA